MALGWLQERATGAAQAGEHGPAGAAEGEQAFDLGEMLSHHILNGTEIERPFMEPFHLPTWDPIQIGSVAIDLSPTKHTVFLVAAAVFVAILVTTAARTIAKRAVNDAPTGFANAIEALVVYFRDEVCKANIGHGYERFTPLILTFFFFILTMNLAGLVPYGATATGNISVTAALALITFFVVEIAGFFKLGPMGYAKTIFFVPPGIEGPTKYLLLIVMVPVEFLGKLTKPFALAIRLFANMTAGHMLILSLLGLIFVFGSMGRVAQGSVAVAAVAMVFAIMLLELLVATIQAYIFAMLSAVFIGLMQHEH